MFVKNSLYSVAIVALCALCSPAQAQESAPPAPEEAAIESPEPTEPESSTGKNVLGANLPETATTSGYSSSGRPSYYDEHGEPYTDKYYQTSAEGLRLALQRDPSLPAGHFVLFVSTTRPFSNCAKILSPKYSTETDSNGTMTIKMEKFTIDERDMPRYPHYECNNAPQEPGVRINLSKEILQENQVKKMRFRVDKTTENFTVKMTDDYVLLMPESSRPPEFNRFGALPVHGVSNPLKFWFYPEGTVILTADGASKDVTLESQLKELARTKGLTPLEEVMPDHAHFRKKTDWYYFVDKQNHYAGAKGDLLDYIQADAMKFGLEADEPVKKNVAVFIRTPGQYD